MSETAAAEQDTFLLRFHYARTGPPVWLAHLDMMRLFERAMARAHWPVSWRDAAYNPRPELTFALPVGCGIETRHDPVDVRLTEKMDVTWGLSSLNASFPSGLFAHDAYYTERMKQSLMARVTAARYELEAEGIGCVFRKVFTGGPVTVIRHRKGKDIATDLAKQIVTCERCEDDRIILLSAAGSRQNMRPDLLAEALIQHGGWSEAAALDMRVIRQDVFLDGHP